MPADTASTAASQKPIILDPVDWTPPDLRGEALIKFDSWWAEPSRADDYFALYMSWVYNTVLEVNPIVKRHRAGLLSQEEMQYLQTVTTRLKPDRGTLGDFIENYPPVKRAREEQEEPNPTWKEFEKRFEKRDPMLMHPPKKYRRIEVPLLK